MAVQLNHTIVWVHNHKESADFLTSILGLPEPERFGPFLVVRLENEVSLDLFEKGRPTLMGRFRGQNWPFNGFEERFLPVSPF